MSEKTKRLTNRDKDQLQIARVFAVLQRIGVGNAEQIADEAGEPETGTFCTPTKATAALKFLEQRGIVEEAGPDPTIKRARRTLKRWRLTFLGGAMAIAILQENEEI